MSGDRTRASWKRRLFPSVSVPDDEPSAANNADVLLTSDLPSGNPVLLFADCRV